MKNILIVGTGITGLECASFFTKQGDVCTVIDEKAATPTAKNTLASLGVKLLDNWQIDTVWLSSENFSFAIVSPGINPRKPLLTAIREAHIETYLDLDIAIDQGLEPLVGVTGSNGKSTTVTLIHEMLKASGIENELVGNIGRSYIELCGDKTKPYVAELSSYQLECVKHIRPHVGVWLNLSENHLERHGTMGDYLKAKTRLFANQTKDDYAILSVDNKYYEAMVAKCSATIIPFGIGNEARKKLDNYSLVLEDRIFLKIGHLQEEYHLRDWRLVGVHNQTNLAAAIAASRVVGATQVGISKVIKSFQGLEHRLELVTEIKGVKFINDSKATTVSATDSDVLATSQTYPNSQIILLLGGEAKIGSWQPVSDILASCNVSHVIGFGQDGEKIIKELREHGISTVVQTVKSVEDAIIASQELARTGDVVLFAPGCASFDSYKSFEERGKEFKRLVIRSSV